MSFNQKGHKAKDLAKPSSGSNTSSSTSNNKDQQSIVIQAKADLKKSLGDKSSGSAATTTTKQNNNNNNNNDSATEDKFKVFEGDGVVYKAKLIGSELVMDPKGDKMCQNSIQRLKAIIRGQKTHKKRIVLKISYDGVKVHDEKTNEILHSHEVPQISFIASDETDARTFGYVCDVPNKAHQFICFKTNGPAAQVMTSLSDLFEAVFEKKNQFADKTSTQSCQQQATNDTDTLCDVDNDFGSNNSSLGTSRNQQKTADGSFGNISNSYANNHNNSLNKDHNKSNNLQQRQLSKVDSLTGDLDDLNDSGLVDSGSIISAKLVGSVNNSSSRTGAGAGAAGFKASTSAIDIVNSQFGDLVLDSQPSSSVGGGPYHTHAQFNSSLGSANMNSIIGGVGPGGMLPRTTSVNTSQNDSNLTRQSSFASAASLAHNDSQDKYAVFNDIDNLPSIFESTSSLGSAVNLSNVGVGSVPASIGARHQAFSGSANAFMHQRSAHATPYMSASSNLGGVGASSGNLNQSMGTNHLMGCLPGPPTGMGPTMQHPGSISGSPSSRHHMQLHQQRFATSGRQTQQGGGGAQFYRNYATSTSVGANLGNMSGGTAGLGHGPISHNLGDDGGAFQWNQPTPSMMVPISGHNTHHHNPSTSSSFNQAHLSGGMIVGSAPMPSHQMGQQHSKFSSSMVANMHQHLGSSATSIGSAGALTRQTNPFDDDFFA